MLVFSNMKFSENSFFMSGVQYLIMSIFFLTTSIHPCRNITQMYIFIYNIYHFSNFALYVQITLCPCIFCVYICDMMNVLLSIFFHCSTLSLHSRALLKPNLQTDLNTQSGPKACLCHAFLPWRGERRGTHPV